MLSSVKMEEWNTYYTASEASEVMTSENMKISTVTTNKSSFLFTLVINIAKVSAFVLGDLKKGERETDREGRQNVRLWSGTPNQK